MINYWPFAARLQARGYRPLIGVNEMAEGFGLASRVPLLGYVFRESEGEARRDDIMAFLDATREAKAHHEHLECRMGAAAAPDAGPGRRDLCRPAGRIPPWHPVPLAQQQREDAAKLFTILAEHGGEKLVGTAGELSPGTFWPHVTY